MIAIVLMNANCEIILVLVLVNWENLIRTLSRQLTSGPHLVDSQNWPKNRRTRDRETKKTSGNDSSLLQKGKSLYLHLTTERRLSAGESGRENRFYAKVSIKLDKMAWLPSAQSLVMGKISQ